MKQIPENIASVVKRWPYTAQTHFEQLRSIVHDAAQSADVGELNETLKWNEPA